MRIFPFEHPPSLKPSRKDAARGEVIVMCIREDRIPMRGRSNYDLYEFNV